MEYPDVYDWDPMPRSIFFYTYSIESTDSNELHDRADCLGYR